MTLQIDGLDGTFDGTFSMMVNFFFRIRHFSILLSSYTYISNCLNKSSWCSYRFFLLLFGPHDSKTFQASAIFLLIGSTKQNLQLSHVNFICIVLEFFTKSDKMLCIIRLALFEEESPHDQLLYI